MLEPQVEMLDPDTYRGLLREKWVLFNSNFNEKHWNAAKQCLLKQNNYLTEGKISPICFSVGVNDYFFLEINPDKFESNDEKSQFVKEANFLRLVDFQLHQEEPLNLGLFLDGYQSDNSSELLLTQLFIKKK